MTLTNFRSVRRDLLRTKQRIYECDEIGADSQRVGVTSPMPNGHSGGAYTRLEFPMNDHFLNLNITGHGDIFVLLVDLIFEHSIIAQVQEILEHRVDKVA